MDWLSLIRELGIMATACGFFVWTSWLRENRLTTRLELLEAFVQDKLLAVIGNQSTALEKCTQAMEHSGEAIEALSSATMALEHQTEKLYAYIEGRPCLLPENHPARVKAVEVLEKSLKT